MGGKRPDQHNISRAEAGATDYKTLPEDERINTEDHQKVEATKKRGESKHMPERNLNPALQEIRDRKDVRGT